jgi:hypothetical protein
MTAATPAAGSSWDVLAAPPSCLAGLRCAVRPACSSCRPPSRVRLSTTWPGFSEAVTTPSCVGSCNLQPVKAAVWGARRLDRGHDLRPGRPASHTAPPASPCGHARWLIGQLVDESCFVKAPLRDAGEPPPVIPRVTGDRRCAQANRCGRDDLSSRLRRAIPDYWVSQVDGVDATPARQPAPVAPGSYLPHSTGKTARPPSTLAAKTA